MISKYFCLRVVLIQKQEGKNASSCNRMSVSTQLLAQQD